MLSIRQQQLTVATLMFAICQICHEIPRNSIYYPKLLPEYLPLEGVYLGAWDLTRQHARAATNHPIFFPKSIRLLLLPHLHFGWRPGIHAGHILCMANDFLMACANVSWCWEMY